MKKFFFNLKQMDGWLMGVTIMLLSFGFATLYSITMNQTDADFLRFYKQVGFGLIGLLLIIGLIMFDYRIMQSYDTWFLIAGIGLLVAVLLFGTEIRGTKGWFVIGGINWQPVEICKILYLIWLSSYLHKHYHHFLELKYLIMSGAVTVLFMVLVLLQPDFGSAILFLAMWTAVLGVLKVPLKYLLGLGFIFIIGAIIAWNFIFLDYQKNRILTFLRPASDPLGSGYNVTQSMIAVGSGELLGRGLGLGPQSQLNFLPERESDFIFAVVAEELGFVGASILFILLTLLLIRIYRIALKSQTTFGTLLCVNVASIIFWQAIINIGMNMGVMPVTGIPLPFLSAGGSALLADLVAIGLLQNVYLKNKTTTNSS